MALNPLTDQQSTGLESQVCIRYSGRVKILGKYFFSFKMDVLAFTSFIPLFFLYYVYAEVLKLPLPDSLSYEYILLGWTVVDGSHVYSTIYVSYADREVRCKLKHWLYGIPLALSVITLVLVGTGNKEAFTYFLAYLAIFHFVRQEFGWMNLSSRFDSAAPKSLLRIDQFTAYAMTIIPLMWLAGKSQNGAWYTPGDLFLIPDNISHGALSLYWPIIGIFLVANSYHSVRTRTLNLSKLLVFTNTFFGWYMSLVFIKQPHLSLALMIVHHGLPYYFLTFKAERVSEGIHWNQMWRRWKYPLMYFSCVIAFIGFYGISYVFAPLKKMDGFFVAVAALLYVPQMVHFVLDGLVWKRHLGLTAKIGKSSQNARAKVANLNLIQSPKVLSDLTIRNDVI